MRRRSVRVLAGIAAVVAAALVGLVVYDAGRRDRIPPGLTVARVEVGGLSVEQARLRLRARLGSAVQVPFVVSHRGRRFVLRPSDAGGRLDDAATARAALRRGRAGNPLGRALRDLRGGRVEAAVAPRVRFQHAALRAFVADVARAIDRPARDADIEFVDGKLRRRRAQAGLAVRRAELERALVSRLTPGAPRTLGTPVTVTERPDLTMAELAKRYPTVVAIDRDAKVLRLYRRLRLAHRYRIAVGRLGFKSSAGRYEIESKTVDPPWHAPDKAWAGELAGKVIPPRHPRNPLKARWLGYHDGEGIHGTDDVASLGTAASHGCIRMSIRDVKELYRLVPMRTPVFLQ